jgi:hypothetical protein
MSIQSRWFLAAAACVALTPALHAAPVPATAGGDALSFVPAQAPIVIQLRGVERTKERLKAFLNAAVPDFAPIVASQLDNALEHGFAGRKLTGLVKDGTVFVAFLELPQLGGDEPPPFALIARVTDFKAFRDGVLTEDERKAVKSEDGYDQAEISGHAVYFLDRQGFAMVTHNKDVAMMLAKKPAGLDGKLSPDVARQLMENDLSMYVNLAAVNKEFGDTIKTGRGFFEQIMDSAASGDKASIESTKVAIGGLFQAIEDGKALLVAADFRPEGLNLHVQFQVGPDTKTNKVLQSQKPGALDGIGTLPAGFVTYSATQTTGELFKSMAPMLYGAIGGEGEGKKQAEAAVAQLIAAGSTGSFSAANVPPAGVQVQIFKDPVQGAAAMLALFRAMSEGGSFQNVYVKGKPEVTENAQEYKGFKLSAVHITWDLDKMANAIPGGGEAGKIAMKKMMGEEMRVWFGTDGKRVVTVTAKDWDAARARLDGFLSGQSPIAKEPAFAATRSQLPAETTLLMLADAGRFTNIMADYMVSMFKAMPGLPFNLPDEVKPVKTKTSYLGFAATLKPENAGIDIFVPVVAVQEMRKVIMPLLHGGAE